MSTVACTGVSARTLVAGVAGRPVHHSLSPLIHNAWLSRAGVDGVYVAFAPEQDRFAPFVHGLRGGVVRGLNITAPFKTQALEAADTVSQRALAAGSANLLVFSAAGDIRADNTDGVGLLAALGEQAPEFSPAAGPAVILGAGGAARGAAAALLMAGAPAIRLVARSLDKAATLAAELGGPVSIFPSQDMSGAFDSAALVINATPMGLAGEDGPPAPMAVLGPGAVVMDMVYRPLRTGLLTAAAARGLIVVDGLAMLIHQAVPSFEAFFGGPPPVMDTRALALAALGEDAFQETPGS